VSAIKISNKLKTLQRQTGKCIICLVQLNRSAEMRQPVLSDLREAGQLEEDADGVFFIYDPNHSEKIERKPTVQEREIHYAKNRNGEAGGFTRVEFNTKFQRFYDPNQKTEEQQAGF